MTEVWEFNKMLKDNFILQWKSNKNHIIFFVKKTYSQKKILDFFYRYISYMMLSVKYQWVTRDIKQCIHVVTRDVVISEKSKL